MDWTEVERRARRGYEARRLQRATLGASLIVPIAAAALAFGHRPVATIAFAIASFVVALVMLWYGRAIRGAVMPGVVAGLVPLVAAMVANRIHVCGPNGCSTLCVQACTLGGLVAGLVVGAVARQRKAGVTFWIGAASIAALTGAMGCTCIGFSGVVGLLLGLAVGTAPAALRQGWAR